MNPPADAQCEVAAERQDPSSWMNTGSTKLYRAWHLCLNNPGEADEELYTKLAAKSAYAIVAREVGLECGTPHFQGYVYFKNARSQSAVLKDLKGRGYVKPARANAEKNTQYCEKQGDVFIRHGEMPKQGERKDIQRVLQAVQDGESMSTIIQEHAANYQDIQIAEKAMKYMEPARTEMPEIYWYWGDSGTGKSKDALEEASADGASVYTPLSFRGKFWEGYDGHDNVVIHDFRPDWMPFPVLLQLLDRYEFRVENKGSSRQFRSKKIWITTPYPPERCVPVGEEAYQLLRRIKVIRKYEWPVNAQGEDEPRYEPLREIKVVGSSPCSTPLYETESCSTSVCSEDSVQFVRNTTQLHTVQNVCNIKNVCAHFFPGEGVIKDADAKARTLSSSDSGETQGSDDLR